MTKFPLAIFDSIANILGLSNSVVATIILLLIAVSSAVLVLVWSRNLLLSLLVSLGVIILGAFLGLLPLWIALLTGFIGFGYILFTRVFELGDTSIAIRKESNPKELILRIEKSSSNWSKYINNLDSLLGIKTINDENPDSEYGLRLNKDRELSIHPGYDWYITDKHLDKDIFKVVGLHKEDSLRNLVYLLGKDLESEEPFLVRIPDTYLERDLERCLAYSKCRVDNGVSTLVDIVPAIFTTAILISLITWLGKK